LLDEPKRVAPFVIEHIILFGDFGADRSADLCAALFREMDTRGIAGLSGVVKYL
jgi:hypothetical protein